MKPDRDVIIFKYEGAKLLALIEELPKTMKLTNIYEYDETCTLLKYKITSFSYIPRNYEYHSFPELIGGLKLNNPSLTITPQAQEDLSLAFRLLKL